MIVYKVLGYFFFFQIKPKWIRLQDMAERENIQLLHVVWKIWFFMMKRNIFLLGLLIHTLVSVILNAFYFHMDQPGYFCQRKRYFSYINVVGEFSIDLHTRGSHMSTWLNQVLKCFLVFARLSAFNHIFLFDYIYKNVKLPGSQLIQMSPSQYCAWFNHSSLKYVMIWLYKISIIT